MASNERIPASIQENIDKLTKAWRAQGKALPVLFPLEAVEVIEFFERLGISKKEGIDVFRVLTEQAEVSALTSMHLANQRLS